MAVQAISARDTHHRHAQSRCSAHRIPPTDTCFFTSTARHGLALSKLKQSAHAPHCGACAYCIGVAGAWPWSSAGLENRKAGRVDQSPSAAGGEDWVLCARARWLATRVAWVSSAECQVAHETGHGGTHMHGTVWTGRAVGKALFVFYRRL